MKKVYEKTKMTKQHYIAIYISFCVALIGFVPNLTNIPLNCYIIMQVINLIVLISYLVHLDNKQIKAYNDRDEYLRDGG